jgi:hypothetical protein
MKYALALPPIVKQPTIGDEDHPIALPVCWACALSSWLKVVRGSEWSFRQLVQRFKPFCGDAGGLDLSQFDSVADALFVSMYWEEKNRSELTFDYLHEKLMGPRGSHLYVILEGKNPAHCVVVYGLNREKTDLVGIMDPLRGVRAAPVLSEFRQKATDFLVGWAKR